MFIWLSIVLCCPVQTSQWGFFFWGIKQYFKEIIFREQCQTFYGISQWFCFFLFTQYPHCLLALGLGLFGASPTLLLPDTPSPDFSHSLCSACPFWDPAWETLLPTFIPGTAGTELSSDSGCPFKSLYFVPNVSVPNQLAQEYTEKVMAKQSAYYTHLISKAFGCCFVSVGQLTANVYCSLIVQLIKAIVWAGVNIPPWTTFAFTTNESAITAQIWPLVGKIQYYFNIATIWFKEKW